MDKWTSGPAVVTAVALALVALALAVGVNISRAKARAKRGLRAARQVLGQEQVPPQSEQPVIRFIREPDAAPEFAVKGMDGKTVSLPAGRGKVALLNFWATWCGPCQMEVPDLVELQTKYKDRLQVIGLVVDDTDEEAIRNFAKKFSIKYPIALATSDMSFRFGGVPALA